ncbi:hypothetical protein CP556_21460 [Natrinema sp. CBA1119]|uniref:outer membrane protein assembly factor BamB family protein n=1 Tax=Natrinema sp. CBA1119 TaxID=1608465 RepID=UPI000BF61232|nr:PQQ-binding-like beta-propeller repeat protein [Natrinema sp. CBA1119]PGF14430.1 hypothetical protein CP556_21460 [Natrinema sp. CBA1119]
MEDRTFVTGASGTIRAHTSGAPSPVTISSPEAGTWPGSAYDSATTAYNPTAAPPTGDQGTTLDWWKTFETAPASEPASDGDRLYVSADNEVIAFNAETLDPEWRYNDGDLFRDQPVIAGPFVLAFEQESGYSNTIDRLHVIEAESGSRRWDTSVSAGAHLPVVDEETAYLATPGTVKAYNLASGSLNWQFDLPEVASAQPALTEDRLFVLTEDGEGYGTGKADLYALDPETGNARWRARIGDGNGQCVVADDQRVYATTTNGGVTALTHNGDEQWTHNESADNYEYLVANETLVYVTTTNGAGVTALEKSTGNRAWRESEMGAASSLPSVTDAGVLIGTVNREVLLLDADTGDILWRRVHDDVVDGQIPIDETVYVAGGSTLRAHIAGTAEGVEPPRIPTLGWATDGYDAGQTGGTEGDGPTDEPEILWDQTFDHSETTPPATDGDTAYIAAGDLKAVDLRTGESVWTYDEGDTFQTWQPVLADDTVLAIEYDVGYNASPTALHAVDVRTGTQQWQIPVSSDIYPPVVAGGMVYIAFGSKIEARSLEDGTQIWQFETDESVNAQPAIGKDRVYVLTEDGEGYGTGEATLYAIDASDGNGRWQVSFGDGNGWSVLTTDTSVFATTRNGGVTAFTHNGKENWTHNSSAGTFGYLAHNGDTLFVTTNDSPGVTALNPETGDQVWQKGTEGEPFSQPAATGETLYVGTKEKEVLASSVFS